MEINLEFFESVLFIEIITVLTIINNCINNIFYHWCREKNIAYEHDAFVCWSKSSCIETLYLTAAVTTSSGMCPTSCGHHWCQAFRMRDVPSPPGSGTSSVAHIGYCSVSQSHRLHVGARPRSQSSWTLFQWGELTVVYLWAIKVASTVYGN